MRHIAPNVAFKKSALALCFTAVLFSFVPAHAQLFGKKEQALAPIEGAPSSFADLSDKLVPAVVNISSTQKIEKSEDYPELPEFPEGSPFEQFFEEFRERRGEALPDVPAASLGSGFVIDGEKGYVVTNNHVIKDADEVRVTFHDDTSMVAEIVGKDDKTDLALLKIKTDKKIPAVKFGNSDSMRVGDWVIAIGNPFGLGGTVTAGIISARKRDIQAGPYDDFIQTDASINRGNSGGPMFNMQGEVIGINTAIFSPSGGSVGIGFAIPSSLAKPIIDQLIKYGKTRRGWLGVRIQTVTEEIAESLGLKGVQGALVASLTKGGPAEKAGLQPGDIILEFNGQALTGMRQLPRAVAETAVDEKVPLTYWRDGKKMTTSVVVGELEKAEEDGLLTTATDDGITPKGGVEITTVGLTISGLGDMERKAYEIPEDAKGVVVTNIADGSEAQEKGLVPGDVIVEINQLAVTDPTEAKSMIDDAAKAGKPSILLLVDNQGKGDVRFVALKLKKETAEPKTKGKAPAKKLAPVPEEELEE